MDNEATLLQRLVRKLTIAAKTEIVNIHILLHMDSAVWISATAKEQVTYTSKIVVWTLKVSC